MLLVILKNFIIKRFEIGFFEKKVNVFQIMIDYISFTSAVLRCFKSPKRQENLFLG